MLTKGLSLLERLVDAEQERVVREQDMLTALQGILSALELQNTALSQMRTNSKPKTVHKPIDTGQNYNVRDELSRLARIDSAAAIERRTSKDADGPGGQARAS